MNSQETGSATERIGVQVDEDFRAAFNVDYLISGVTSCGSSSKVRLSFNEPLKPALISPVGEHDDDDDGETEVEGGKFTYLLMPMRDPDAPEGS